MFAFVAISNAQSVVMTGTDTVTNTGTVELTQRIIGTPTNISIQVKLTKLSGTVNGYTTFYGSMDGVTYTLLDTAMDASDVATNTAFYHVENPKDYVYIKLIHTGVGTMSAILSARILIRKD